LEKIRHEVSLKFLRYVPAFLEDSEIKKKKKTRDTRRAKMGLDGLRSDI
jgi:hypothetical protein